MLGAVAYDPKVVTIWEGMRDYFVAQGVARDFALFSNYESGPCWRPDWDSNPAASSPDAAQRVCSPRESPDSLTGPGLHGFTTSAEEGPTVPHPREACATPPARAVPAKAL